MLAKAEISRPYYRSKLFWCAVVFAASLLVSWWDSNRYAMWFSCRWGPEDHYRGFAVSSENGTVFVTAGRPYQGIIGIYWTGIRYGRTPLTPKGISIKEKQPIYVNWEAKDRLCLGFAHWLIGAFFILIWIIDSALELIAKRWPRNNQSVKS